MAISGSKPAKHDQRGQKSPEEEGRSGPNHLILHQGGGAGTVHPRVLHKLQIRLEAIWNYIGCRILRTSECCFWRRPSTVHAAHTARSTRSSQASPRRMDSATSHRLPAILSCRFFLFQFLPLPVPYHFDGLMGRGVFGRRTNHLPRIHLRSAVSPRFCPPEKGMLRLRPARHGRITARGQLAEHRDRTDGCGRQVGIIGESLAPC